MPKRMVDGDRIWTSEKLRSVEPAEWRFHYANLLPLALANGSFECEPLRVQRDVYVYLRPEFTLEDVRSLLREYERVKLLFRWHDEAGKAWGFWVGIRSEGLLPAKAHVDRGDYKKGKEPPPDLLRRFLAGEIISGLNPGGEPGDEPLTTGGPPARVGKDRLGLGGVGDENQGETDMKPEIQYEIICQTFFGKKPNLRGWNGDQMKRLEVIHKSSSVLRAFGEWCKENEGNPDIHDPIKGFLQEADELLAGETPASVAVKDPAVVNLTREFTYLSGSKVTFQGRHKVTLAELLSTYSTDELVSVFRTFIGDKDLEDPYVLKYVAQNFLDAADGLAYTSRRKAEEVKQAQKDRDTAVARLQAEAEADRLKREADKTQENNLVDTVFG